MNPSSQTSTSTNRNRVARRTKSKKNVSISTKKNQAPTFVGQQLNHSLQTIPSEKVVEIPRYMNTYRMEPKYRFNCTLVQNVVEEIVQKHCFGAKYDSSQCVTKVQVIAEEILRQIKKFRFDRYRLIVYVQIGEKLNQDFETAARFLWDSSKDKFVTFNLTGGSLITTVTCFGVYLD